MLRRAARTFTALLAACLFAVLSAVSAHQMAPDREAMERQAALLAMGETLDALCGLSDDGAEHHCPFCHKLPDAPRITAPDNAARITRVIAHHLGQDLVVGPQDIRAHAAPRAPPRSV
ncbi:hypothetical protein [Roseivivax halotolerans]|uniref:hypothetical protein n=1 Tax=Roseivivax halotolerans TaxID=93684 RepID=UPI00111363C8|nr:hypothetical protein [Roseivivax halotolerans]